MENKKGLMLVISGPAGSGKGTVNNHLLETGDFVYSVSATTRPPRPGEINGKNYHFITREEFEKRIKSGDMLEYTEYCTNLYGTPKKEAEEVLASGKNLILEIEVEGAANVKAKYPDAVLILLLPPSFEIQEQRLRNRGTETEEKILLRLARTKEELKSSDIYDYVVYNHDGRDTEAAEQIMSIVNSERCALKRNPNVAKLYFSKNK
ncbi:MAG: guanylate kinase [Clostridia bacterium]|nr:guanylate kinase [Clostridia bacterium]